MNCRYNVKQVAQLLGVTEKTIRRYFRSGKLEGFKDGKSWYTNQALLDKYEYSLFCKQHNIDFNKVLNIFTNEKNIIKELKDNDNGGSNIRDNWLLIKKL